jgi:dihydroxyacetone kinase-like protein
MLAGVMTAAAETRSAPELRYTDLGPLLAKCVQAMLSRGRVSLGDKTVVDGIAAIADAVGAASSGDVAATVVKAVEDALAAFKPKPALSGRARLAGERTVGMDDPGMVALLHIVRGAIG